MHCRTHGRACTEHLLCALFDLFSSSPPKLGVRSLRTRQTASGPNRRSDSCRPAVGQLGNRAHAHAHTHTQTHTHTHKHTHTHTHTPTHTHTLALSKTAVHTNAVQGLIRSLYTRWTCRCRCLQDVEADGLGQGSALPGGHDVPLLGLEGGGAVHRQVAVALLESVELLDVVQVVTSDDDGALHLRRDHHALKHSAADADVPQAVSKPATKRRSPASARCMRGAR